MGLTTAPEAAIFKEAVLALEAGDLVKAERALKLFLKIQDGHFGALNLLTLALMRMGRHQEAEATILRALRVNKRDERAWTSYAIVLRSLGRYDEAVGAFDKAIKLNPRDIRAWNNRGSLLKDLGRHERAIPDFDRAIALDSAYFAAYYNKAGSLAAMRRLQPALAAYDALLKLKPDFVEGWLGRGLVLAEQGRLPEALQDFDKAIALNPAFAEGHFDRGNVLLQLGQAEEALTSYDKALALQPNHADAHYNRGNALGGLRRFNDAASNYEKAIALDPRHAQALNNLGNTLVELNRLDESLVRFDQAIALRAGYADAHYNRSVPLLLTGRFDEGWREYEWRKQKREPLGARRYKQPLWTGDADLSGKSILVHWEQGFGDTIQMCRYVKRLEQTGARVLFAPQKPLRGLMRRLSETIEIVDAEDSSLDFDCHCPLMSLPLAFKTTLASIPAATPYLSVDSERIKQWAGRLGPEGFRIGIAWRGSAFGESVGRSAPLALFRQLAETPGVRLISLHKPEAADALIEPRERTAIEVLGGPFDEGENAFMDTAAVIENLDLVITVDTATAHLGGALNAPTWIALKSVPDWRWLLERSDSPWYPSRPTLSPTVGRGLGRRLFRDRAGAERDAGIGASRRRVTPAPTPAALR